MFGDEVEKIEADQKRLRENIETLSKTPEAKTLIARYIAKADEQKRGSKKRKKSEKICKPNGKICKASWRKKFAHSRLNN